MLEVMFNEFADFASDWPTANRLRGQLIDKDIEGTITHEEKTRLTALQAYANYYIQATTPSPTAAIDKLESKVF